MKDLIVSVADIDQEKVVEALLPRIPRVSGTRFFTWDIVRNMLKDSGSCNLSHEFLRPYINQFNYCLVLFDYEGSGVEHEKTRAEAEIGGERLLSRNGWDGRNAAIVIEPELENWMWIDSHHLQNAIAWKRPESLYQWARSTGRLAEGSHKPARPKESFEEAIKISFIPRSSSIYKNIASRVSYRHCEDLAFRKLISTLEIWFPLNGMQ